LKRLTLLLLAGALAALILQPVSVTVNPTFSKNGLLADGTTPPPFAKPPGGGMLLADGFPMPTCAPCGCSCRQNLPDAQAVWPATQLRLG